VALPGGCGDDHGYVEGDRLVVSRCAADGGAREFAPFRIEFSTFGVDPGRGPVYVRAQRHGEPLTGGDGLVIVLEDGDAVQAWHAAQPQGSLPFGRDPALPPGEPALGARASLLLAATCPDSYQALVLDGGALFVDALGTGFGDHVHIRFQGADVRDLRTGEVVGSGFAGALDFEVRSRKPYRWYDP
jgi:hypothetical protein